MSGMNNVWKGSAAFFHLAAKSRGIIARLLFVRWWNEGVAGMEVTGNRSVGQ